MSLREWITSGGPERAERERCKLVYLPVPHWRFDSWRVRLGSRGKAHRVLRVPDGAGGWKLCLGCRYARRGNYVVVSQAHPRCVACQRELTA